MPSTTVHIPDKLLSRVDQIVKKKGISRNRFIVQACEQALDNDAGQWPEDSFESGLSKEQLKLLREGVAEMEEAIISMRRNRMNIDL
jgi:metal-responsive CopG/Arc/MetJ family transcriptional regulator